MSMNLSVFMASNSSSDHSLTPETQRCRDSSIVIALRRRSSHRKYSGSTPVNFRQGFVKNKVSARKLAAGLWQLRFVEVSGDCADVIGHRSFQSSKFKLEAFKPFIKSSRERETKWNHLLKKGSNESTIVHWRKLMEDRKLVDDQHDSIVEVLLEELLQSQRMVRKLKAEHNSSKKKFRRFMQNVEEEKMLWKCKEHKKREKRLDELEYRLIKERRSKEKMEILNTKLLKELDEANRFRKNYEKEKRKRELTEKVCDELSNQIEEDKAEIEKLMREAMKIYKEVEEEREMTKMIELWREERVQMKLEDAKNLLEEKYTQMVELIAYLQRFLRSKGDQVSNDEIEDARLIEQEVESVNIRRILELSYNFSKSDDAFPIYDECSEENGKLHCSPASNHLRSCRNEEKRTSVEGSFKHNSRDSNNPHITRGMKGCIEWPKGIKTNSKVIIPLEERVRSQKSQLQHILKPKAF